MPLYFFPLLWNFGVKISVHYISDLVNETRSCRLIYVCESIRSSVNLTGPSHPDALWIFLPPSGWPSDTTIYLMRGEDGVLFSWVTFQRHTVHLSVTSTVVCALGWLLFTVWTVLVLMSSWSALLAECTSYRSCNLKRFFHLLSMFYMKMCV